VGVGRTEMPEDVELSDVNVAAKALPNSRVAAHVTIRHSGAQQQTTKLTVRDGSRIIQSREITLKRGNPVG
jgi:purine-nucleoside phosphorylase